MTDFENHARVPITIHDVLWSRREAGRQMGIAIIAVKFLGKIRLLDAKRMVVMKTIHWVKLLLIAGIIVSFAAVCIAAEWGTVMYAHSKTPIREKRSVKSRIKGHLKEKQAVRVDFMKKGWYAVFPITAKERKERKALGYVYNTHLSIDRPEPAAATPDREKKQKAIPAAADPKPAVSDQSLAVDVKSLRFKLKDNGRDTIFIELNRFYAPALSSIEGAKPRIVLDMENVSSFQVEKAVIQVDGEHIRQIRTSLDRKTHKARIVLDLEPLKDYYVQPEFAQKENLYSLHVLAEDKKKEP